MTAPAVARRWAGPVPAAVLGPVAREQLVRLRRAAPWGAVLFTALVAHVAVMPHLVVGGVAPDGLVVAVVAVAAGRGARAGAAFGFAAGLGADLLLATPLGTSALAYTALGHGLGRLRPPRPLGAAAALCTPASTCFSCRIGRRHPADPVPADPAAADPAARPRDVARPPAEAPPAVKTIRPPARLRRRVAARRAGVRRSVVLTVVGVTAGQLAVAAVATALGGVRFPDVSRVLGMAGVAGVSAPLGPPLFVLVRRLAPCGRSRR